MTTVDVIIKAIEDKKSLAFSYHGFERTVSPFACGILPTNELKMLAFQTAGGCHSGITEKLRLFAIEDIAGAEIVDAPYKKPCDACTAHYAQFANIYAQYSDDEKSCCCGQ